VNNIENARMREQLLDRRQKLQATASKSRDSDDIRNLLNEVDAALEKVDKGTFGLCETCLDTIEEDRLLADPLIRNCLTHLTAAEQRALEHDLDLAYKIQAALLPKQNLKVGGWVSAYHYQPAGPVSGDYCDLIVPDGGNGTLYFLLGDVSGKGVAASILMAHLHAIFRTLTKMNLSVHQLVEEANLLFSEGTMSTHFATLVCGKADADGRVEICNAGHCFPLVVRANKVESVPSTGLPLGTFSGIQYSTEQYTLVSGESLFLYSDGLSESRNRSDVEYGEKRLASLIERKASLTPEGLIGVCLDDLKLFRSGVPMADDLTLMSIRRVQ